MGPLKPFSPSPSSGLIWVQVCVYLCVYLCTPHAWLCIYSQESEISFMCVLAYWALDCFSQKKASLCVPACSHICMYLHRNPGKPLCVSVGNLAFQIHFHSSGSQTLLCTIFNQPVDSLAGWSRSLVKWQGLVHRADCIPPSCSFLFSPSPIHSQSSPTVRSGCLQPHTCEMMIEEQEPLTHQSLSLLFAPPSASWMLDWALVVVTLTMTDAPGWTGLETPSPPKVISAPALPCWPGPSQVRE